MTKKNTQIDFPLPGEITLEKDAEYLRRELDPGDYSSKSVNGHGYDDGDDTINLREIWRAIWKRKWMIAAIVMIVTTLTAIQAFRIKPWYSSSTVIEIGKENSMVLNSAEMTLNDDSDPLYMVTVNTKKLALESPELFEEVVNQLDLTKNEKIVKEINDSGFLGFLGGKTKKAESPERINVGGFEESLQLKPFTDYLAEHTSVEQLKNTRALKVSFTNEDPVLAAEISKNIADVFSRRTFSSQTERFRNSADWLDRSTRELKTQVQKSEEALADYTRVNEIYAVDNVGDKTNQTLTTSSLTQLHDKYIRARTDRLLKESLYEQVNKGRIEELPEVFSDPKIIALQKALSEAEAKGAELQVKFGPTNPKIVEVKNQIGVLKTEIQKSRGALENKFRADYERAVKDERLLDAELNNAKTNAVTENQASIRYNILKQDVDTARSLYTDFLQKTNQANAQVAEQNKNIKVIQEARIATKPDGPKRLQIILLGFMLSLFGSIGLAYLLERLDETIKTAEDIDRYTRLPVLGIIPSMNGSSGFFRRKRDRLKIEDRVEETQLGLAGDNTILATIPKGFEDHSMISEAYLSLRTSLLLSSAEHPPKTMLFTSSVPGEGKTTTSLNTAVALTKLGAKVLVIDCDLRRPTVHKKLGVSAATGLTNYLSSSESKLEDLIQELPIKNLSVLTCGPIPPNPSELLSSRKMREMLEYLYDKYDHIIIDTPPIISVADAIILSTVVDGTIVVVQSGNTTRDLLQLSIQKLGSINSKVLGAVLNNVNLRNDGYSYYKYDHYHTRKNGDG